MGSKKLNFINRVAGAANKVNHAPTKKALEVAAGVDKETFLNELEVQWWDHVKGTSNVDTELEKARKRIRDSKWESIFETVGITDEDLRTILQRIIDRKVTIIKDAPKVGRNSKCPCGSGKKYKKCCMND